MWGINIIMFFSFLSHGVHIHFIWTQVNNLKFYFIKKLDMTFNLDSASVFCNFYIFFHRSTATWMYYLSAQNAALSLRVRERT